MKNDILLQQLIHADNPFENLDKLLHLTQEDCDYVIKERFRLHNEERAARRQKFLESKKQSEAN
jgi:hypothetical protein